MLRRQHRDRVIFAVATPLGVLLLVVGQVGARTGWFSVPFDPHHFVTQIIGLVLLAFGLPRWR